MRGPILLVWKLAPVAAVLAAFGLAVAAAEPRAPDNPQPPTTVVQPAPKAVDPKPLPKGPNQILFYRNGHLTLMDPAGEPWTRVSEDRREFAPQFARLSPDGTRIALLTRTTLKDDQRGEFFVRGLEEKEPGTDMGFKCHACAWSPDGAEILCGDFSVDPDTRKLTTTHFLLNVKTKEKTVLKLPDDHLFSDWSRNGKYILTLRVNPIGTTPFAWMYLMNRDGTEHKALATDFDIFGRWSPDGTRLWCGPRLGGPGHRLSPDGTRVLCYGIAREKDRRGEPVRELVVLDIATGKSTKVAVIPSRGQIEDCCWSPDGKRIAYGWKEHHEDGELKDLSFMATRSVLVVCDPDGKNAKTLTTEKGTGQYVVTITSLDWR